MGLSQEKIGKLEEEAQKRRQHLLSLKRKRIEKSQDVDCKSDELPECRVLFRNYQPFSEKFEESILPPSEPGNVEELVKKQLTDDQLATEITQVEMSCLAPKKVTFDLRRGIEKQLVKLEKRTDKAIAQLIREKLKEGRQQDFLVALNAGVTAERRTVNDSDDDDL